MKRSPECLPRVAGLGLIPVRRPIDVHRPPGVLVLPPAGGVGVRQLPHDDRRFAIQREQHLRFEIEQIVDALAHPRIAEGAQCIGAVAHGAAPRETCALDARDRTTRCCDQLPIVEKFQVSRDHFLGRAL